jgi:uncharacterized protein (TIGR00725 family)
VKERDVTEGGGRQVYVAVVGDGQCDRETAEMAVTLGRTLARGGAILVCGGLGGVMEAACRGAREGGGLTVGILPTAERGTANPFVDVALPTALGHARNYLVARSADVMVAVRGGYGTLSEMALALKMGIPVVGLDTWRITRPGYEGEPHFPQTTDPEEAARLALELA